MIFLLLAAAVPQTVIEADRALAKAVKTEGQWTAFRRFAAPDAVIFQDGPHQAATLLADWRDPAVAMTWTVTKSITSCDGTTAYTLGSVRRPAGGTGSLVLVWRKRADGKWKWVAWKGAAWAVAFVAKPRTEVASCAGSPPYTMSPRPDGPFGHMWSPDRTFSWRWQADRASDVTYSIQVWNGTGYVTVLAGDDKERVPRR